MKKFTKSLLTGTLTAVAMLAVAEDKTVLNLTFDEGLESGVYEFGKRGSASLVAEEGRGKVLAAVAEGKKGPAGVILMGNAAKELCPEKFTWSLKFKYTGKPQAEMTKTAYGFLMDSRYRGKSAKGGVTMNLITSPKGATLVVTIGYQDGKAGSFRFNLPTAMDGKWHEVAVTAANPKLSLTFDGKTYNRVMLGIPAPACQRLTIGDCVGSSYSPFPGLIDDVKLTVPEAPATPAAK